MQGNDSKWLQISACAKHFAVHSWNTPSHYMAFPTKQDMADTYLPAFEAAVVDGGVSGFMCSYNGVDGTDDTKTMKLPILDEFSLITTYSRFISLKLFKPLDISLRFHTCNRNADVCSARPADEGPQGMELRWLHYLGCGD
jgi:hypothetical protein